MIFSVNLVLTLMIATAPPGLQNITAQYVRPSHRTRRVTLTTPACLARRLEYLCVRPPVVRPAFR